MSGENPDLDAVMGRIVKLLALSKSSNPHEASLAAEKAQELMFAYDVSLAQVEGAGRGGRKQFGLQEIRLGLGAGVNWRRRLLCFVADVSFCRAYFWLGTRDAEILGRKHNVEVAEHLYRYLEREISRLAEVGAAVCKDRWESTVTYKSNFGHGATEIIALRLYQKRDQLAASPEARALVVVRDQDLDEYAESRYPKTKRMGLTPGKLPERPGYTDGVRAGKKIPIDDTLKGGTQPRQLAAAGMEQKRMGV